MATMYFRMRVNGMATVKSRSWDGERFITNREPCVITKKMVQTSSAFYDRTTGMMVKGGGFGRVMAYEFNKKEAQWKMKCRE